MPTHLTSLPTAMLDLTNPLDWNKISDSNRALEMAYGFFHQDIGSSIPNLRNVFSVSADQDRLYYAEEYALAVLGLTDLGDFKWFRRGVWLRETVPTTRYTEQRDHSVHTLHNYLIGWYFFVNSPLFRDQFEAALRARVLPTDLNSIINLFGEIWCFVSLLHDIGYLFEGEIPNDSATLLDEGIRDGVRWAYEYFEEILWDSTVRGIARIV
jgi:hypothetical protein